MYYISKKKGITFISIITIVFLVFIFILNIRKKSIDNEKILLTNTNIDATAKIYSNLIGIPHICSASDDAIFFAMGYEHARERLYQMWQWKIIAEGRLSEFYGEQFLDLDIFMRAIDIEKIADKLYNNTTSETKNILQSYSNGINTFIKNNGGRLSVEFATLNYIPEEWRPQDCYIIQRFIAFLFSNSWYNDILFSAISNKTGTEKAQWLVSKKPINNNLENNNSEIINNNKQKLDYFKNIENDTSSIIATLEQLQKLTGFTTANVSGNTWAIYSSNDSNAILANDYHLPLTLPNMWLQMHISSPSYNVLGYCIPGMPIFFAARNNYIAWGMTNMLLDDVDYLVQKTDKNTTEYYINDTLTAKIDAVEDSIKINGQKTYKYYKTSIKEQNLLKIKDDKLIQDYNYYLTINWTGNLISDEVSSMLKVMKAKKWNEFINGVNAWQCPGLVFSFADINGNIGIAPRAIVPGRATNFNPLIANLAWEQSAKIWISYITPKEIPTTKNPPQQFIYNTNNTDNSNIYYGSYNTLSARNTLIEELLSAKKEWTALDVQYQQNNNYSIYAKEILSKLIPILNKNRTQLTKNEQAALYKLMNWDYIINQKSNASSIYSMFIAKLISNIFEDELGSLFKFCLFNKNIPLVKLKEILDNNHSLDYNLLDEQIITEQTPTLYLETIKQTNNQNNWIDNIKTNKEEQLDEIIITSFKNTCNELTKLYKTENSNNWLYSKFHYANFENNFNNYNKLAKYINTINPGALNGDISTINYSEWNYNKPFIVVNGVSMRFIADMKNDATYMIIAGGVSADPLNPNYSNQILFWQIDTYFKLSIDEIPTNDFKLAVTITP